MNRARVTDLAAAIVDVALAVAAATGAVAVLEHLAPVAGLGIVYLLAVFFVAFRRGQIAALSTAVFSVLALNFFFIEPRHRLTIADSRNVVALAVLLIAGLLVSRLVATARQRSRESEARARLAAGRERESALLADVASSLLQEGGAPTRFDLGEGRSQRVGDSSLRLELVPVPKPRDGETATPLQLRARTAWLYAARDSGWSRDALNRIAEPLARLLDVAIERDEVQQRTAEVEAARRADLAKTAVLHAISHDLRSPLTSITTAAGALRSGALSESDRDELLSVLSDESARLARLVEDLLDLSRIEAGAVNPQEDWCDLSDAVMSAAEQQRAKHPGAGLRLALDDELPLVRADPAQMERVFSNLIDNALKFSPADEPVEVRATSAGHRVTVRVADHGPGIARSTRAHIFEPFYTGGADRSGSGLGLTICRGFAEANGAEVRVHSRRGEGTSFTVSFQLVPQPATPA